MWVAGPCILLIYPKMLNCCSNTATWTGTLNAYFDVFNNNGLSGYIDSINSYGKYLNFKSMFVKLPFLLSVINDATSFSHVLILFLPNINSTPFNAISFMFVFKNLNSLYSSIENNF